MVENTAIPQGSWVLVTAANGHTGSHIVIELLKRGFKVRGTVRNLNSGQWLLNDDLVAPYVKQGHVELVVADTSIPGAFDNVVKGMSAIIHVAIITDFVADPNVGIPATVEAALTVCWSAAREPSVQRFVFTSTFWAATFPTPGVTEKITNLDTWNEAALKAAWAPPPYGPERMIPVYCASKIEAEKAVWKFVRDEKLPWVVNSLYLGNVPAVQGTPAMYYSHVTDVAVVHVAAALDESVNGQRIQVLAKSFNWDDCLEILRGAYPNHNVVENFQPDHPRVTYDIQNDIAPTLIQKWAGRDWIDLKTSVLESMESILKFKKLM